MYIYIFFFIYYIQSHAPTIEKIFIYFKKEVVEYNNILKTDIFKN